MATYDAIVVGAGHNGLIAAAYLGKAGKRVLVLERRHVLGGAAVTEEIHPGFQFSELSYVCSMLRPEIIWGLDLPSHGFHVIPQDASFTPLPDGKFLSYRGDDEEAFREISKFSRRDAEAMTPYSQLMTRTAKFIAPMLMMTPPDLASLGPSNLRKLFRLYRHFKAVGEQELHTFAQLMTMSAADFLDEWFESEPLKGGLCADGITGAFLGPRSPGTAWMLLHHFMGEVEGPHRSWGFVRGGTGMVSEAIAGAARAYGVEIRASADVRRILVKDGRAHGVELANGETIRSRVVVSNADPKRTFLTLVEPGNLPSDYVRGIQNFNLEGSAAKVNLALSERPDFGCLPGDGPHLSGIITIGPDTEYIERAYDDAKYGDFSRRPFIDVCIPSTLDPSVAPPGKHIMSMFVQYAPYTLRKGTWPERREDFGDTVIETLEEYVPNLRKIILHRQVISPWDVEREFGLTGGNIFHGEPTPDQLFFLRPVPGWAQYRTPIKGLYLCGSGTHPGGGIMGAPGHNAAREILKDWRLRKV
ncbi:MAG TPA: NAD(P)/FAD-dependent oxidoreductase [Thermoplasmata archaeon]|nr:NAD(P)/FAD-dependent oxidoreductase [Thermoplasmata archaeon]